METKLWRLGNYEILEEIGRGAMGVIYRARQRHSRRLVAIKRVLSHPVDSQVSFERFRLEAQAAASLDHPHILPIYEIAHGEDGLPFFSMKLAPGGSLEQAKAVLGSKPRSCVALIAKVARAVQYAHREGILHRDLKPENILLDAHGEPLVSDFGLAKWLDTPNGVTRTATSFGTPGYIAPEQAKGDQLTPAADVYSLGAILFDLVSGRPPFLGANTLAVIQQAAATEAPKLTWFCTTADRDLETICAKCLEREPRLRYESAGELAQDCESWLEGRSISARPVSRPLRAWRWSRRNPVLAASLAACALFAMLGAIWYLRSSYLVSAIERRNLEDQSLAILPILDLDKATTSSAASMLLTNELFAAAGEIGRLVRTTPSSRPWPKDYAAEARALGVRYLVLGTTRQTAEGRSCALHWFDVREGRMTRRTVQGLPQQDISKTAVSAMLAEPGPLLTDANDEQFGTRNEQARRYLIAGEEYYSRLTPQALETAIGCARKAIAADPSCAPAYSLLASALGMRDAFEKEHTNEPGEAAAAAAKSVELAPNSPAASFVTIGPQLRAAKYAEALNSIYRTIELGLDLRRNAILAAMACKWQGNPELALRWIRLAQQSEIRPGESLSFEGAILAEVGDDENARRAYQRSIDLLPDRPDGLLGLAELCLLRGDTPAAIAISDELSRKFPEHVYAAELAAQIALYTRDFDRASELYGALFRTDKNGPMKFYGSVSFASGYGYSLLMKGRRAEAVEILRQALQRSQDRSVISPTSDQLYDQAATETALGRNEQAIVTLRRSAQAGLVFHRFAQIDPRFDSIRSNPAFDTLLQMTSKKAASFRTADRPEPPQYKQEE